MTEENPRKTRGHSYKELRLQQLRSFLETARTGSLAAAARALGLAQPTVWEQVHALEREFEAQLIDPGGKGCRLTDEGRLLVELAQPVIQSVDALHMKFQDARHVSQQSLSIVVTPRTLMEDIPRCLAEFEKLWPEVRLTVFEKGDTLVPDHVLLGEAELGMTPSAPTARLRTQLIFNTAYLLSSVLITPKNHPLAKRRSVTIEDIAGYPMVNAWYAFSDPHVAARFEQAGAFRNHPSRVAVSFNASIRHYVKLGFGVGIVSRLPDLPADPDLHERPLDAILPPHPMYLVYRADRELTPVAEAFRETLSKALGKPPRGKAGKMAFALDKESP